MKKKLELKAIIVLSAICLIIAALLAGVNALASPIIEDREAQKVAESLKIVVTDDVKGTLDTTPITPLPENAAASVKEMYGVYDGENATAYVFTMQVKGYAGQIYLTVGVTAEGKLMKAVVTADSETHGKADIKTFPDTLAGKTAEEIADAPLVTGATVTSTAIKTAVIDAINTVLGKAPEEEAETLPREESEIESLAKTLSGSDELTNVTPEKLDDVKRIYKAGSKGYVAYAVIISQYGTVETETLIHIGSDGKIKNINKLVWKTSEAMYGYVPPTEEEVNAFYERLVGAGTDSIGSVELVTNATNTSTNLVGAITEALSATDALIKQDLPREESEIIDLAKALAGEGVGITDITPLGKEYVRRLYSLDNGEGYIAYIVVISKNYGTVETETLVSIGNDGKIKGIDKLTWKTSDAIYGYEPPTQEEVDAFYEKIVGKGESWLDEKVNHVTNATNTTGNLFAAIREAIAVAEDTPRECAPDYSARIIGIAVLSAAIVGFVATVIITRKRRNEK